MIALILDVVLASLLSKYINKIWTLLILGFLAGIANSFIINMLIYVFNKDIMTPPEMVFRIFSGSLIHSIIIIVLLSIFKRKPKSKKDLLNEAKEEKASVKDIEDFIELIKKSPSREDIAKSANTLLDSGYDKDSLIDIVKERLGRENVLLIQEIMN